MPHTFQQWYWTMVRLPDTTVCPKRPTDFIFSPVPLCHVGGLCGTPYVRLCILYYFVPIL